MSNTKKARGWVCLAVMLAACNGQTTASPAPGGQGSTANVPRDASIASGRGGGGSGGRTGASRDASLIGTGATIGTAAGGAPGPGGAGSVGGTNLGGGAVPDAGGLHIVRELPPGAQFVPGPTPTLPQSAVAIDYIGYTAGAFPPGRANEGCASCNASEWCFQSDRWPPYGAMCAIQLPPLNQEASSGCFQRPVVCNDDCPVVCGCDGVLYCNACIAAAWGHDRTKGGIDGCLGSIQP